MPRVVVAGKIHSSGLAVLRERQGLDIEEHPLLDEARMQAAVAGADALLLRTSTLSATAIKGADALKIVARHGVGYDNIDVAALTQRGIPLALVGNVNAVSVAEHTLYLLLACMKRGLAYDRATRNGGWQIRDTLGARDLKGKTLLIIGFGRIGSEVAARASAFGMKIEAYDPLVKAGKTDSSVTMVADLDAAIARADAVSLHLPLMARTRNLFDAKRIAHMKLNAVLICTARGGLIDEDALAEALREGRLMAAGLDVYAEEPPAATHALLALDNVVLSPHSAALTEECAERMAVISAQNCLDGLDGRVDPSLIANPEVLGGGKC
jgi:D-3-phosphoglycerate dehydrogenase / 2-oxoglutarate reductase